MTNKISGKLIITTYKYEKLHKENETHRVACFIADNRLEYIKVIPDDHVLPAGTILTGKVTNVVTNIPAAFVALNSSKDMGFLPLSDLEQAVVTNGKFSGKLKSGDEVLVKVIREPMKTKEYTLSAKLDMTAHYAVAHMGNGNLLFSKKLSAKEKDIILNYLVSRAMVTRDKKLIGMDNVDITIRTDAGRLIAEEKLDVLLQDVEQTTASLRRFISQASMRTCYAVHQKPVTWLSEVRHELHLCDFTIEEYVTDDFTMLQTLKELVNASESKKIRLYHDEKISLTSLYGLKYKIDELLQTKVWLPSGGYLCIEPMEAMTVVDVNSGKAIRKSDDSEALFYEVNTEAAAELARQLRLRNISGMIIVDFINMKSKETEHAILNYMKEYAKTDYSKVTVYDFTRLGLLELTRNKKSKALHEILR